MVPTALPLPNRSFILTKRNMNVSIQNIPRADLVSLIDEIREARPKKGSMMLVLQSFLIDEVNRQDGENGKPDLENAHCCDVGKGFERHYTVDPKEDIQEVLARAKYVSQSLKVMDEDLTDIIKVILRLRDNV